MTDEAEDHVEVAVLGKKVYVKPFGYATQRNSLGIPDFLDAMFRAGCNCAVFDLADCKGMDSTFLGVMAEAATALPHRRGKNVVVLNADQRAERQLRRVGLMLLVTLRREPVDLPQQLQLRQMDFVDLPKTQYQRLERIRDLHRQLVALNSGNRELFGPFLEMLDEEIQQSREEQQEG